MNDHELDTLVAAASPVRSEQVDELALDDAAAELREAILAASVAGHTTARRHDRRRWVAAAAAAAVLTTGLIVTTSGGDDGSAYAAEVVEVAKAAPRMLVTADGWTVERADEFSEELGELTFANGNRQLDLHWRPSDQHDGYVDDRVHSSDPPLGISVEGHDGVLFRYSGTNDYTALWLDGDHSVEFRGVAASEDQFRSLAASLEEVTVDEWLAAMPDSVVKPTDRAAVIEEMLEGIPLPPRFDTAVFDDLDESVSDRYQLGARVAGAVACAWIDQWVDADADGDAAAKTQAAEAIGSTKQWPILVEMAVEGDYPEVLWEYADDINLRDGISVWDGRDRIRDGAYTDGACLR